MYQVIAGDETSDHSTRKSAISQAKDLSSGRGPEVEVQDANGRERMTYRNGALEHYVYELRDRPRG